MGALFSANQSKGVIIPFDTSPTPDEQQFVETLDTELSAIRQKMAVYDAYEDCHEFIRKAMSNPTPANKKAAFAAVQKNVLHIKDLMAIADSLANNFTRTIHSILQSAVEERPATAKKFAEILDIVMQFDEIKMKKPGLQNDFSFYRRNMSKHEKEDLAINEEDANYVSLFIAQACPLMHRVVEHLKGVMKSDVTLEDGLQKLFATVINSCLALLKSDTELDSEIEALSVRAMVGSIVVFDKAFDGGVFRSNTGIHVKGAVQLVCKKYAQPRTLVNALQYASDHFQDASTPSYIKNLLEKA